MDINQKLHFIGIGGYGMSAVARVMLDWGYSVSGSDMVEKDFTIKLRQRGAEIFIGHNVENIKGADIVIYSTDIPADNIELNAAIKHNIPVLHRSEMLAYILQKKKGITVAGAHGKTTTSSMIAWIMEYAKQDPTYIIGGEVLNLASNAHAGSGEYAIAEADESDGSFLNYSSHIAVVTNIEADHLENYDGNFENLKDAYRKYMAKIDDDGMVIVFCEDEYLMSLTKKLNCKITTYGTIATANWQLSDIQQVGRNTMFSLTNNLLSPNDIDGNNNFTVKLPIPGKHNCLNATAAIIATLQAGVTISDAIAALQQFQGARRRFTLMGQNDTITIVDDYAHHPTEIRATLAAAKATGKKVVAIFQPQRYTRTFFLFDEFARAFTDADELFILDIYSPAKEKKIEGITSEKLTACICEHSNSKAKYVTDREQLTTQLLENAELNTLIITMGAGDIWLLAEKMASKL